jgi:1-acyl-sn-glycerol-3-phosphate acyltransferase
MRSPFISRARCRDRLAAEGGRLLTEQCWKCFFDDSAVVVKGYLCIVRAFKTFSLKFDNLNRRFDIYPIPIAVGTDALSMMSSFYSLQFFFLSEVKVYMSINVLPKTSKMSMPKDGKTKLGYAFWNFVNELIVVNQFRNIEVVGAENIPEHGAFILFANHSKRWDGPVVQYLLNRRANYMVSPNEMKGLQGAAVISVGAFPANPRLDPVGYALNQLRCGEPVVVFPEGNVFYDGEVHAFKPGVAKIAINAALEGCPVPAIPMYIKYGSGKSPTSVKLIIGRPVKIVDHLNQIEGCERNSQRALSQRFFDEVIGLRDGATAETARLNPVAQLV